MRADIALEWAELRSHGVREEHPLSMQLVLDMGIKMQNAATF